MIQRVFSFYAFTPEPKSAPMDAVIRCTSEVDAICASLHAMRGYRDNHGELKTQKSLAQRLAISGAYISQMKTGERQMPDWMVAPFCRYTGTNLMKQYREYKSAIAATDSRDAKNARTARIAAELRVAA